MKSFELTKEEYELIDKAFNSNNEIQDEIETIKENFPLKNRKYDMDDSVLQEKLN